MADNTNDIPMTEYVWANYVIQSTLDGANIEYYEPHLFKPVINDGAVVNGTWYQGSYVDDPVGIVLFTTKAKCEAYCKQQNKNNQNLTNAIKDVKDKINGILL